MAKTTVVMNKNEDEEQNKIVEKLLQKDRQDIKTLTESMDKIVFKDADFDDTINPSYYRQGMMECIDAIEGLNLQFHEAQVLKYITRWRLKGGKEDLLKAQWYLNRLLDRAVNNE